MLFNIISNGRAIRFVIPRRLIRATEAKMDDVQHNKRLVLLLSELHLLRQWKQRLSRPSKYHVLMLSTPIDAHS